MVNARRNVSARNFRRDTYYFTFREKVIRLRRLETRGGGGKESSVLRHEKSSEDEQDDNEYSCDCIIITHSVAATNREAINAGNGMRVKVKEKSYLQSSP